MSRSNSFIKRQKTERKRKEKLEKEEKKTERKKNSMGGDLENMMAYVDENGNISSQPPDKNAIQNTDN